MELEFIIKNISPKNIYVYDNPYSFIKFYGLDSLVGEETKPLIEKQKLIRNDGRKCKRDFIPLALNEEKKYILEYKITINTTGAVAVKFVYDMPREENWYYNFENEGINTKTRIQIDALTGLYQSNKLNLFEKSVITKQSSGLFPRLRRSVKPLSLSVRCN